MKVLYAIQGTGNGHLSRAAEIIPYLLNFCQLDLLISGTSSDIKLNYLIKYKKKGVGYTFGKNGGIDLIDSIKKLKPFNFIKDIYELPVKDYDVVINDFEPVSAWACKVQNKYCFGLSHQAAYLSSKTPRANKHNKFAEWIFKNYAPVNDKIGFHFKPYDSFITTPIIRKEIRQFYPTNNGHITVYLPAYSDEILTKQFEHFPDIAFEIFSKHASSGYRYKNSIILPISGTAFGQSLSSGNGLITNAGFESPAEAMYLRKKVLAIPMRNQYEQQCNAAALQLIGCTVFHQINEQFKQVLKNWLTFAHPVKVNYRHNTLQVLENAFSMIEKNLQKEGKLVFGST